MSDNERELKALTLPSGKTAQIVTYFTRGEFNEIKRRSWGDAKAEQQDDGNVKIISIPVNQGELQQDAIVLMGTKKIEDKDVTEQTIKDLPVPDFNFIELELSKLYAGYTGKKKTN